VRWADTAAVFFTAGTTGQPKGALTSHSALAATVDLIRSSTGMTARDSVILPMPMFYTGGLKASLANLLIGARVSVFRSWSPGDIVDAIDEQRGTFVWAVNTVWGLMLRARGFSERRVQSIRAVWRAGSHTPRALLEDLLRVWPDRPHFHSYGLTECNIATMERDALSHPESVGFPNHGVGLSIDGRTTPEREGEIWLTGPQQFSGYANDPEATRKTLVNGWVRTGDLGRLEPDGRLQVIGRGSEIIIRGGENIAAAEVERALLDVPGVVEAAVVGVPDDMFGQELKAVLFAEPAAAVSSELLRTECQRVLAEFKIPKWIEIRREPLPRNPAGKIAKSELK
jgi:acyl-CoA synthetase (AMP-forming)/AMP-acid ligase II